MKFTRIAAIAASVGLAFAVIVPTQAATLTSANQLQALTVEEKLAHDVYVTLGSYWNARRFTNIANSESRHYAQMQTLLKTYRISDMSARDAIGKFDEPVVQQLYNRLVAEGKTSLTAAYGVGVKIEKLDIADLDALLAKSMPADVKIVLTALRAGSTNHLAAFSR